MSIRSARSRQVDPNIALPIQYRTVSFNIEESKGKDAVQLAQAKDKTTKGMCSVPGVSSQQTEHCLISSSPIASGLA
jgi:sodium/potassium-transporting ATPase subunit alpha